MARPKATLIKDLVFEHFGEIPARVAESLATKGRSSLISIAKNTGLKQKHVQQALFVLVHQRLVEWTEDAPKITALVPRPPVVLYAIHEARVLLRLYFPRIMTATETIFGPDHATVIRLLLLHGALADDVLQAEAEHLSVPKTRLSEVLAELSARSFIERLGQRGASAAAAALAARDKDYSDSASKSKRRRVDGASSSSSFSSASSSDSQSASAAALATIPAGETPWIVNTDRFLFQFALDAFVLFAEEKIGAFAREILNAMLRLTDRALGDVCVLPHANRVYPTVTQNQLFDAMYNERMNRGELGRNIEMFVELLVNDPVPFLIKTGDLGGGTYQLNIDHVITVLQQAQVETLVLERYGAAARRILRILFESKFLEQKQIAQLAMVPVNDARSKLYALLSAGFLQLQEIPKTPDRAVSRTLFLFNASLPETVTLAVELAIGALVKIRSRLLVELGDRDIETVDRASQTMSAVDVQRIHRVAWRLDAGEQRVIASLLVLRAFT